MPFSASAEGDQGPRQVCVIVLTMTQAVGFLRRINTTGSAAGGGRLLTGMSLLFEFGLRLGDEIACHVANLAQGFAVESHAAVDHCFGSRP